MNDVCIPPLHLRRISDTLWNVSLRSAFGPTVGLISRRSKNRYAFIERDGTENIHESVGDAKAAALAAARKIAEGSEW